MKENNIIKEETLEELTLETLKKYIRFKDEFISNEQFKYINAWTNYIGGSQKNVTEEYLTEYTKKQLIQDFLFARALYFFESYKISKFSSFLEKILPYSIYKSYTNLKYFKKFDLKREKEIIKDMREYINSLDLTPIILKVKPKAESLLKVYWEQTNN